MVYVIMGVMGSGKTTAAQCLAEKTGSVFYEGDIYHSGESIEKMKKGVPLNDKDRVSWLEKLRNTADRHLASGKDAVIACSVLKEKHRRVLGAERRGIKLVYLKASEELIQKRLEKRKGHFASSALLKSQFEALEEPENALVIDASREPEKIVNKILNEG